MSDPHDRDTHEIEQMLQASRPVPHPGFRGELKRRLLAAGGLARPPRIRRLILAYAGSGALLLLVAAAGLAGAGPLSA